jgi:hypothetical protein
MKLNLFGKNRWLSTGDLVAAIILLGAVVLFATGFLRQTP